MSAIGMLGALLAGACGGGVGGDTEPTSAVVDSATGAISTTVASGATLKLFNLPAEKTTATTASIVYELDAPAPNSVVACRLNTYTPIVCPNPFRLGQRSELPAGIHTVQYYVDNGRGVDPAKPDASYTWTIEVAASSTAGINASQPATGGNSPPSGALAAAPVPVATAVSGSSPQWDGKSTITGSDGVVRLGPVADPNGSGRRVNLHRIVQNDPLIWGGQRSELVWIDKEAQKLYPGRDYWMAFAVMRKPGEAQSSATPFGTNNWAETYDELLVMQTHTPQSGATQPDIALFFNSQGNYTGWRVAYNTSGNVDSNGNMSTEGNPWVHKEALPAPGEWVRYVVHYRPGYDSTQQPRLAVWRAKAGAAFEQIVNHTGLNTYNTSKTGAGPSYPRIGPYGGAGWKLPSYAFYMTTLYFAEGADMLEAAKASLAGL